MRRFGKLVVTTALCISALAGVVSSSPGIDTASAAEWQLQAQVQGERYRPHVPLLGISCQSASFCVAVGELGKVVWSVNPTGGASAWDQATPTGEAHTDCHAHWSPPCTDPSDRVIRAVSCPSVQLCIAVTGEGYIYSSTNPAGAADAWQVADVDGNERDTHLLDISCPTTSLCVAVSGEQNTSGKVLTSTNPTGGASAWKETQLDESLDLRGVSCGTPTLCVAVARHGRLLVSTNPTGGAEDWRELGTPGGPGDLQGISCAATVLCVAGNAAGNLLTSADPTGGLSTWREASGDAHVQITDVDCLPTKQCIATSNNGDIITSTDPTVGDGSWSRFNLIPYVEPASELEEPLNGLFGVSCPSSAFCALVAADGQIFTNTDPFAAPTRTTTTKGPGRRKKTKRPKVMIAKLLFPSRRAVVEHRGRITARFHANGPVRRFECKLRNRHFRRCHSPGRFRVGNGTYALRIRAVGITGLHGPVAVERFWIGKRCVVYRCYTGGGVIQPKGR
jgi:hypothetical protein